MPASTLRRTVSIWASPSAPALSLRLIVPVLLCHVFHLPRASNIHPPRLSHSRDSLNFSPASLRTLLLLLLFPYYSSRPPSFHRIFVASFSPHHSLTMILHHLSAILTSRSIALRSDVGRVHETPRRCQRTDSTTLNYASSHRYYEYLYNLVITTTNIYVCRYYMYV